MTLKKLLLPFLLLILSFGVKGQGFTETKIKVLASGYQLNCLVWRSSMATNLPVIFFFHGSGEAGIDITKMYGQGLPAALKGGYTPPFPCIIICPQATSYGVNSAWLPYIWNDVVATYKVDTTNAFATGLSAGGWGTWGWELQLGTTFASKLKAIIPLSAATQDAKIGANFSNFGKTKTPVWAIVGALDYSYVEQNQAFVDSVNKYNPASAKLSTRAGIGHTAWIDIYNNKYNDGGVTFWSYVQGKLGIAIPPPVITADNIQDTVGQPLSYQVKATGTGLTFSSTVLPAGLTLSATGLLSGIPSTVGIFTIAVTAKNSGGSDTKNIVLTVLKAAPVVIRIQKTTDLVNPGCSYTITFYNDGTYVVTP